MDVKIIEQKQLVERYLTGRLPPPEAKFFEKVLRDSPGLAEQLGLHDALKRTMRLLDETGTEWNEQKPRFWHNPWLAIGLGAALAGAVALAINLWIGQGELRSRAAAAQAEADRGQLLAPTSTQTVPVKPGRPGEAVPLVQIGSRAAPTFAELRIDVRWVPAGIFRVVIKRNDGTYWARLDHQLRDSNGDLRLAFNSAAFSAGIYELQLEAVSLRGETTPAGRLRLQVSAR